MFAKECFLFCQMLKNAEIFYLQIFSRVPKPEKCSNYCIRCLSDRNSNWFCVAELFLCVKNFDIIVGRCSQLPPIDKFNLICLSKIMKINKFERKIEV